jgi:hypothetical protein
VDPRIHRIRVCCGFLSEPHGGDRELGCLVDCVRDALMLGEELLERRGVEPARGYADLADKLILSGTVRPDLGERLRALFDVGERLPTAWSTVSHAEFARAIAMGVPALREFADVCERELAGTRPSVTT